MPKSADEERAAPQHGPDPQRQLGSSGETLLERQFGRPPKRAGSTTCPTRANPFRTTRTPTRRIGASPFTCSGTRASHRRGLRRTRRSGRSWRGEMKSWPAPRQDRHLPSSPGATNAVRSSSWSPRSTHGSRGSMQRHRPLGSTAGRWSLPTSLLGTTKRAGKSDQGTLTNARSQATETAEGRAVLDKAELAELDRAKTGAAALSDGSAVFSIGSCGADPDARALGRAWRTLEPANPRIRAGEGRSSTDRDVRQHRLQPVLDRKLDPAGEGRAQEHRNLERRPQCEAEQQPAVEHQSHDRPTLHARRPDHRLGDQPAAEEGDEDRVEANLAAQEPEDRAAAERGPDPEGELLRGE